MELADRNDEVGAPVFQSDFVPLGPLLCDTYPRRAIPVALADMSLQALERGRLCQIFHDAAIRGGCVKCLAPMVRYGRLPFRLLCLRWGCDVVYTPMLVATAFIRSSQARDADFTTTRSFSGQGAVKSSSSVCGSSLPLGDLEFGDLDHDSVALPFDGPLVVQFAASDPDTFATACVLAAPFADGVDLNCGCPQRWAMAEGFGSALLQKRESVDAMLRRARAACPGGMPVSVKIRLLDAHHGGSVTAMPCCNEDRSPLSQVDAHVERGWECSCQQVGGGMRDGGDESATPPIRGTRMIDHVLARADVYRTIELARTAENAGACECVVLCRGGSGFCTSKGLSALLYRFPCTPFAFVWCRDGDSAWTNTDYSLVCASILGWNPNRSRCAFRSRRC